MTSTNDTKQQFIEYRAKGYSLAKIAEKLGKCRQTLSNWNSDLEEEISTAKAIELESLFEECFINKEHRVKNLSNLLSKVREELEERSFEDLATEKLVEIAIKLTSQLKEEYIEPQIKSEQQILTEKHSRQLFEF